MTKDTGGEPGDDRPLLVVNDLCVRFDSIPGRPLVIQDVSFGLSAGQTLCLLGESGCGKSVTALAIMGLLPSPPAMVTHGSVLFEGQDLLKLPARRLADLRGDRLTMIFQEPMSSLNPAMPIGEQIVETIRRHQNTSVAAARKRALDMLELVRIPAAARRLDDYPHQLSGGMRQRVMIAMALANDPAVLIADEPTTALDVTIQAQIMHLIRSLQEASGLTLLLITHDLGVVAEMADQVAIMYAGRIVEHGPVAEVFASPQHPYTIGLMGAMPTLARRSGRLAIIPGTVPPPQNLPKGCRFASRCPFAAPLCTSDDPPFRLLGKDHHAACVRAPVEAGLT